MASVLVFCAAALADAARGARRCAAPAVLLAVAGGGGLLVEAVGVHTGVPFGAYAYTGDLGAEVLGVPVVVPLAWTMMAWPALVVGRTLARAPGRGRGWSAAPRWRRGTCSSTRRWSTPGTGRGRTRTPGCRSCPGVPLTNYAGWLLVVRA